MNTIALLVEKGLPALEDLKIEIKFIPSLNVYILNYNFEETEDSLKFHPVVRECRSLIVRKHDSSFEIIAQSFYRFFNWNEDEKETEECKKRFRDGLEVIATEKKDGSLITVTYFDNAYHIFTRRTNADETPFINGSQDPQDTFGSRVRKLLDDLSLLDPELTYVFELCTPYMHVTRYSEESLTLISVNRKGIELDISDFSDTFNLPERFKISSNRASNLENLESQLQSILNSKPDDFEGYVLSWRETDRIHRLKYKSQRYLSLTHSSLNQNPSLEKLFSIIQANEVAEVSAVFPNLKQTLEGLRDAVSRIVSYVTDFCEQNKNLSQKEFAKIVPKCAYTKLFFDLKAGKIGNVRERVTAHMAKSIIK